MRNIRVYFDFSCPYCYNEFFFLKEAKKVQPIHVEYYSWEIHPEAPLEGAVIDYPGFAEGRKKLNELGAPLGLTPGNMDKVYNTKKALQLLEEAISQGVQEAYIEAVFKAYFEEQVNVSDESVLFRIAEQVGLKGAKEVLSEGKYLDRILEHDTHCMDIKLEYVPTIEEDGKIILAGVLTLDDIMNEFAKK